MGPQDLSRDVVNGARGGTHAVSLQEGCMVPIRDEADFVAVGLVGDGQPKLPGELPDGPLLQGADRKNRVRQLFLGEREEEIRLILRRIHSA